MNNKQVVMKARKEKDGSIIHEMSRQYAPEVIRYKDIRGGISWAITSSNGNSPHYYCMLGQLWTEGGRFEGEKPQRGKVILLTEYRAASLLSRADFLRNLTDYSKGLYCDTYYTTDVDLTQGEINPDVAAFRQYVSENNIKNPHPILKQAPFPEKFRFGIEEISTWREQGKIDIPKDSIVYEQLTTIQESDLEKSPETKFYAINALRYVVCAFLKYPPSTGGGFTPRRRMQPKRVPPRRNSIW